MKCSSGGMRSLKHAVQYKLLVKKSKFHKINRKIEKGLVSEIRHLL